MIDDNKNNDSKEELKTSSDKNDMDTQRTDENKDSKDTQVDQKKELSDNQLKEEQASKLEEKQTNLPAQEQDNKLEEKKNIENEEENQGQISESKEEKQDQITESKEEKQDKLTDSEDDPNAKWYVVGAASGFEEKAIKTIQDNARKASLSQFFFDFQVPKQEVVEIKRGKKINSEKNFFPGYMLIKMIMNNQTWQLVKNSNKISGFTGNDHKPIPLSQNEALKMLKKADDSIEYIAPKYVYEVGQQIKVIDGPFASFNGIVEEVDEERGRLKISVSIFGRSTPVDLEYTQVEKI